METGKPIMFDRDVAEFFGVSVRTIQRRVRKPEAGEIDPNDAHPQTIGNRRFWLRANVERLAGMKGQAK